MDYYSIAKNRQVKALTKFNECYAAIMVVIFSLIPSMAIISPQSFGSIFTGVGTYAMIWSLAFLGVFQLISYATFDSSKHSMSDRFKFCFTKTRNSFLSHNVGMIMTTFLVV